MTESTKIDDLKAQLEQEMAKWQTKIDEAKLQLQLGSMDAEDKIRPHVEQLEKEMDEAKVKWAQLEQASEHSWSDLKEGLDLSVEAMKDAFSKASKHFSDDKSS